MSKIGKKPVIVPQGVEFKEERGEVLLKGPKGELVISVPGGIKVGREDDKITVSCFRNDKRTRSCHGTMRSLIQNGVIGVTKGWEKKLDVVGVGFHVVKEGEKLILALGFSHPVEVNIPSDLTVTVEENQISIWGINKQRVGLFAAQIRKTHPPDSYKGKGVRYLGEEVKLKPGKMAKTGAETG